MKILAIGNSFSQDAAYYLHQLAAADGVDISITNLYIGGCNLQTHHSNLLSDAEAYLLEQNGQSTERMVSIRQALSMECWDLVVTQQASHDSGLPETYEPYLTAIMEAVKQTLPETEFLLHETWAYELDSLHSAFSRYNFSQEEMYTRLSQAYRMWAQRLGIRLIPSGDVIQSLRQKDPFRYGHGGMSLCRDGYHMNILYGRYLLAAVWYRTLTGRSLCANDFVPFSPKAPNAICDRAVLQVIKEHVDTTLP